MTHMGRYDHYTDSFIQEPCEECISRKAVMDCFKKWQPYMATRIFDFENELKSLPSVQQEPKTDILDKIREEIEALSNANPSYTHTCDVIDREDVLDIIDKYRKEG